MPFNHSFQTMQHPEEPPWTCPTLDSILKEIESVRANCSALREWGQHWKEQYDELKDIFQERKKEWIDEKEELEYKIKQLEKELR